ncbi:transposase [Corallococcus sp. ZKHCc1 1396]|uniref:Transposase n=1 Tax=Corallococcus soli TaxID=2710757 RepID=A0ABR9PZ43_9BACT|nr:transposase [Corallococcus soli]
MAPLRPPPRPKKKLGRPWADNRAALEAIVFVLRSGIPWEMLPRKQFGLRNLSTGSRSTYTRRRSRGRWHSSDTSSATTPTPLRPPRWPSPCRDPGSSCHRRPRTAGPVQTRGESIGSAFARFLCWRGFALGGASRLDLSFHITSPQREVNSDLIQISLDFKLNRHRVRYLLQPRSHATRLRPGSTRRRIRGSGGSVARCWPRPHS